MPQHSEPPPSPLRSHIPQATVESLFEPRLPTSKSRENDTLNVNISAGGLSFTCKEQLRPGDYLQIRLLLLADMTSITSCCQVVYCKPSNPYENDRYPHLIGARFMHLAIEDQEVLNRYLEKHRNQQRIFNGLLLAAILTFLTIPDQVLDFMLALLHFLLEGVLHLLHLLFEYVESTLDHIVEHLFHTGLHQTQIIVFYTLLTCAAAGCYWLWLKIPPICKHLGQNLGGYFLRKKASLLYYWGEQTLLVKIGIVVFGVVFTVCYGYFGV